MLKIDLITINLIYKNLFRQRNVKINNLLRLKDGGKILIIGIECL